MIGLSIILTVFGLTFTILINLPTKEYGSWHFQKSIKSFLFFILFIEHQRNNSLKFLGLKKFMFKIIPLKKIITYVNIFIIAIKVNLDIKLL